jgi:hypothetical protein
MVVVYAVLTIVYVASGDRVNMASSQLCFSDAFLRWQYSQMTSEGLVFYGIAQRIDYILMITYALFAFSSCVTIARWFPRDSWWYRSGCTFALLGIVAACCDAGENAFILITLDAYPFIAPWHAISHSAFAAVKWGILLSLLSWVMGAMIKHRVPRRPPG